MKNNPIDKIRDLLVFAARRKAVICAGVVAVLAIGGAGIAIASNRPELDQPARRPPSRRPRPTAIRRPAPNPSHPPTSPRYARRSRSTAGRRRTRRRAHRHDRQAASS